MVLSIGNYRKGMDDGFASKCLPCVLGIRMRGLLPYKDTTAMDAFLKALYGVDVHYVVLIASKCIKASWCGSNCQVGIDPIAYDAKSGQRVESLMKLVDRGNSEVKGLGVFTEAVAYASRNIGSIYSIYIKGNSKKGKEGR